MRFDSILKKCEYYNYLVKTAQEVHLIPKAMPMIEHINKFSPEHSAKIMDHMQGSYRAGTPISQVKMIDSLREMKVKNPALYNELVEKYQIKLPEKGGPLIEMSGKAPATPAATPAPTPAPAPAPEAPVAEKPGLEDITREIRDRNKIENSLKGRSELLEFDKSKGKFKFKEDVQELLKTKGFNDRQINKMITQIIGEHYYEFDNKGKLVEKNGTGFRDFLSGEGVEAGKIGDIISDLESEQGTRVRDFKINVSKKFSDMTNGPFKRGFWTIVAIGILMKVFSGQKPTTSDKEKVEAINEADDAVKNSPHLSKLPNCSQLVAKLDAVNSFIDLYKSRPDVKKNNDILSKLNKFIDENKKVSAVASTLSQHSSLDNVAAASGWATSVNDLYGKLQGTIKKLNDLSRFSTIGDQMKSVIKDAIEACQGYVDAIEASRAIRE